MNTRTYSVGKCQICGQGDVIIVKDKLSNQLMLICDDCESQWENPDIFFSGGEPLKDEKSELKDVTNEEEIEEVGWKKYIKNVL